MTWDGNPEHRNLHGDGDQKRPARESWADRLRPKPPPAAQMPLDPFNGITEAVMAQVEMIRSAIEAGLTEPQALFYVACLVQVGAAMREGGMLGPMPEPPEDL
jgi:hypothetical protein